MSRIRAESAHGRPCARGHTERYVSTGKCVVCNRAKAAAHYQRNLGKVRERGRERYAADIDARRAQVRDRRERAADLVKAEKRREYLRHQESYKARAKAWAAANASQQRENARQWRKRNRPKVVANSAKRRAHRAGRIPPWLSADQRRQIAAYYALAKNETARTGVRHVVDHIVPLCGRVVSGLHVPWNLQVITAKANSLKSNKLTAAAA